MKLATLREGGRDGTLIVVRRDGAVFASARAAGIAPTLQAALDDWDRVAPALERLADDLARGRVAGEPLDERPLASPIKRVPY